MHGVLIDHVLWGGGGGSCIVTEDRSKLVVGPGRGHRDSHESHWSDHEMSGKPVPSQEQVGRQAETTTERESRLSVRIIHRRTSQTRPCRCETHTDEYYYDHHIPIKYQHTSTLCHFEKLTFSLLFY